MRMTRGPLLARYRCLQIQSGRGMGLVEDMGKRREEVKEEAGFFRLNDPDSQE